MQYPSPLSFYQQTFGKYYNVDGAFGYQCWDLLAENCRGDEVPLAVIHCSTTGYVEDIWNLRFKSGILNYFDIVPLSELRNGDWVIWGSNYYLTPKSHVAMYWNGQAYGQSQSGIKYANLVGYLDFKQALGAFRLKAWEDNSTMYVGANQIIYDQYAGQEITVYGQPENDSITLISAKTNGKVHGNNVQLINDIDDGDHVYDAKLNCNYFVAQTGEALGVRCGLDEWNVPRQNKFLYYALLKNGFTEVGMDNDFWYTNKDVQFACSPYAVLIKDGFDCDFVSPAVALTKTQATTQSMLIKTNERFVFAIVKGKLTPDQCKAWAKSISGIQDLVLLDSGGSTCMQIAYNVIYGTSEHRKISNALAFYKTKAVPVDSTSENAKDEQSITETEKPLETSENASESVSENTPEPVQETTMIDWKQKLSSRKWQFAVILIAAALTKAFGVNSTEAEALAGLIVALVTAVAYMAFEAMVDKARAEGKDTKAIEKILEILVDALEVDE